jgi:hypothetical protein
MNRMSKRRRSPLRCPVCGSQLEHEQITHLGAVTASLPWELHAGLCPEHGWFQAEVISKPPREIFPVTRPGGTARTFEIGGRRAFAFPTVWNSNPSQAVVDPYDVQYWEVDWTSLPQGTISF